MWLGMREARRLSGGPLQLSGSLSQESESPHASGDQGVEQSHDLMKALSQIPIATLAGIDEAFILLDSGLGAIFSAGLARRAAMERIKKTAKEVDGMPKKSDSKSKMKLAASKVKTSTMLKRAVDRSRETHKKHAAQATTMELMNDLVGKDGRHSPKTSLLEMDKIGPWVRRHGSIASSALPDSRCSSVQGDERDDVVLPTDPAFQDWVETRLKLDATRLGDVEADVKWRSKLQHQMLSWEAQQADKLIPFGMQQSGYPTQYVEIESPSDLDDDSCVDSMQLVDSLEKYKIEVASAKTLTTVASTASLNTNRSSPTNVAPPGCAGDGIHLTLTLPTVQSPAASLSSKTGSFDKSCVVQSSSELLAGQLRRAPPVSSAFTSASKMMFGLGNYGSVNRVRRAKLPLTFEESTINPSPVNVAKVVLPTSLSGSMPLSSMGSVPLSARVQHLSATEPLPKMPLSARARLTGATSDSSTLLGEKDKSASRLASLGQARDLVAGAGLRQPPFFVEPHRGVRSTDIGSTPEHMYVRRCAAMGLVPHPGVWRYFVEHGEIDACNRALRDDDVLAIVRTTASVVSEDQPLLSLNLSKNFLSDAGLKEIARLVVPETGGVPPFVALTTLNLSGSERLSFRTIGAMDSFASALVSLPALSSLDLSGVTLHTQTAKLCSALEQCNSLEELSLANCGIGRTDQGECMVAAALLGRRPSTGWGGLCRADFSQNFFGHASLAVAAAALRDSRLTKLSFASNASSTAWIAGGKEIRFHPMQLLLEGLQFNRTLKSLWLSDCGLGPDSAFVLEDAAQHHPCLNGVDLSDNPLGDIGLRSVIRLLLALETEIHSFIVEGHREADSLAHAVKFRLTQPSGIYRLNLRYPHDRATLRQLLKHTTKVRSGVLRHFKFDTKCGKPVVEKDGCTDSWIVPTSGTFSFTFQPPLSSSLHNYMTCTADRFRTETSSEADAPVMHSGQHPRFGSSLNCMQLRGSCVLDDISKQRRTFFAGGCGSSLAVGPHEASFQQRRSSRTSILPFAGASISPFGNVRSGKESPFLLAQSGMPMSTPGKLDHNAVLSHVSWMEVEHLFSDTRLRVSALRFATIRAMFLSFVTRDQQLRFIHACSKDMLFNFVQVQQFCKDRPEITSQIVSSLFASVSGRPSQLMLLGSLSATVAPKVAKEISYCLWMHEGNLSGRYTLDLSKPSNYWVAENCLLVNAWESEISRASQNPDVSQWGNFEMLRNEVYNETPFLYSRDWALPDHGLLRFDYSSIRRPPPASSAMPEASEVNRYLQRSIANPEVKLRALRAVSVHLYMSTHQFKTLVQCFPAGVVRQDFFCMLHARVVDVSRFLGPDLLYNAAIIGLEDRMALFRRVGALHLLNPLHPEGVRFQCNLAIYEERRIVEFLVQLSTEEPGGKVLGATDISIADDHIPLHPVPASWADKGVPSEEETIVCCYEATTVNMNWRMSLAEKYCIGSFNHV